MTDVFKVTYEIPHDHPLVAEHFAAVEAAAAVTWAYVESLGALGYHTSTWNGSLHGVIFNDLVGRADYWKVLDRVYHPGADKNRGLLCIPKKTKIAAAVRAAFDAVPPTPPSRDLAHKLGWNRPHVTDGSRMYFATVTRLTLPAPRVFVRLPRQIDDGWTAPGIFTEVTEGEYMRAIAAHNALVPEEGETP